jgi:L-threonylcarbamoyladenylate synthase
MLGARDARVLEECLARGGVAVFPADTVYGLGCDPENASAVARLYALKGRPPERPAAVMFFALHTALQALPQLGERERHALQALLPGPLTLLLSNPHRCFPLACGPEPQTLGLRVPHLGGRLAALAGVGVPMLQSSANLSGERDARRLPEVPGALREGADLVLDGGELPGTASTVVDLRGYEEVGEWHVLRAGPVGEQELARVLG